MRKVLCVCIGNSDRSPVMTAVLNMFLKNAGHDDVICESAGISENAGKGGGTTRFAIESAGRLGLNISDHQKRRITSLDLEEYELIICVDDKVAEEVVAQGGAKLLEKIHNAQVQNPWPVRFQEQYEQTFEQVLVSMYRVMRLYFS